MSALSLPLLSFSPNISVSSYSRLYSHARSPIPGSYASTLRRPAAHRSSYQLSLPLQVSTSHTPNPITTVYNSILQLTPTSSPKRSATDEDKHSERSVDVGTQYTPLGLPPTANRAVTSSLTLLSAAIPANLSKDEIGWERTGMRQPPGPLLSQDSVVHTPAAASSGSRPLSTVSESSGVLSSPTNKARGDVARKTMPLDYMLCDIRDLGTVVGDMLLDLIRANDSLSAGNVRLTRYHSRAIPCISVHDYLDRLIVHATLCPTILLAIVYYIDKLCALYPIFNISSLTVHRYLITVAIVASKGLSDSFWTNKTYAKVGGISVHELTLLELDFLEKVDWRLCHQQMYWWIITKI